ncbi:hypothetical protein [Dyadobacter sp. CY326]|uniref:hypothetical protein n=1 Tax=Dyadobacter sp. CY326 TaxID=2907300 RepID=UPI001F30530F|nr:hypothetical protein [Dyadobacter sp. CY326]MCE7067970.1 hypothetical protein [Dyadobacter sp. CY326]
MKFFKNALAITKVILAAGLLASCQNEKDADISPVTEQAEKPNNQKANVAFFYKRLVNDGTVKLEYSGPNKIISKEYHPSKSKFIGYNYTVTNQITAVKYNTASQKLIETSVYSLNAEGKCSESKHYDPYMPDIAVVFRYQYNSNGQLEKVYRKDSPNLRQEFTYIGNNLEKVKFFDNKNTLVKQLTYYYYYSLKDNSKLNPTFLANGQGKYLPIFGSFSINLVQKVNETTFKYEPFNTSTIYHVFKYKHYKDGDFNDGEIKTVEEIIGGTTILTERKYTALGIL